MSSSLFRWWAEGDAQRQKVKEADALAKAYYKFQTPSEQPDGSLKPNPLGDADTWNQMSALERIAAAKGHQESQVMQEAAARLKLAMDQGQREQKQFEQAEGDDVAGEQAIRDAAPRMEMPAPARQVLGAMGIKMPPTIQSGPVTTESLLQSMTRNPRALRSAPAVNLLQAMQNNERTMPVATKVGGRDVLVNPKSGAFQDVTQSQGVIPKEFVPLGASVDENGKVDVRWGPPKAEGKALTAEEVARIASVNQAETDLDILEKMYSELDPDYGGPISGRFKDAVGAGQNPHIAGLQNAIVAATPNLARGVFREVGVLTKDDIARYQTLLPSPYDTKEVRAVKMKQLRERLATGKKEMVASLKSAGRNVEGFTEESATAPAAPGNRFDSEAAARQSGAKAGDVIELYDPATAKYRKARLK